MCGSAPEGHVQQRVQGDRDLTVMPHVLGGQLNPITYGLDRAEKGPMETKLIFDCGVDDFL